MTGMPASAAALSAGRIALLSWARMIRTLAPFEIIVVMSVSCCSLLRLASARMYEPPPASTVFWMPGSSWAAQRGCWKLFQDTPTTQPAAADAGAADAGATDAGATDAGATDAGAVVTVLPLEQALR